MTDATLSSHTIRLDRGWQFKPGDFPGAEMPGYDARDWRIVDLPHDWSVEGEYSPENTPENSWLPTGIGWYRRLFNADPTWHNHLVSVCFAGVYMNSTVWLNGQQVGGRPYGFISFRCDVTGKLRAGANELVVRVDNSPAPTARFYHGSGIYGHVDLSIQPEIHLVPDGGIFPRTIAADSGQAVLAITTEVRNGSRRECGAIVKHRLVDPKDCVAAHWTGDRRQIPPGVTDICEARLEVTKPSLWSPESPELYRIETAIQDSEGRVLDRKSTTTGIRTIRWDAETGFWLNERNLKLRGTCEHLEMMPVGFGVPDALWERRLRQLRAMGANAIRTAHNPFPPVFYETCDRLGLLVMDEIFDGWHRKEANDYGARYFAQWWERDTTDWVRRDRHHPCVAIYSIGNETGLKDTHGITGLIHRLDPTRLTTGGMVIHGVDVMGFNGPGEIQTQLERYRAENPGRPIVLTEIPHTVQTRGFYRALTWWRDIGMPREDFPPYAMREVFEGGHPRYNSSYDNAGVRLCARAALNRLEETPWIAGAFRWTGYESFGEAQFVGVEFPKRTYNGGVIDLAGLPKDHFYLYQSRWTQAPMVHLLPHWTHPGLEGRTIPVVAYSNCTEVELFLDGRSLGRKRPGQLGDFLWAVDYVPGELKAIAYVNFQPTATARHRTAGEPGSLYLHSDNPGLTADGDDVAVVTVSIRDTAGEIVPWANSQVEFWANGPVQALGFENGDPMDGTAPKAPRRSAFAGLCRAFYRAIPTDGAIEVAAAAILGRGDFAGQTPVAIAVTRVTLRGSLPPAEFAIFYTLDGTTPTAQSFRYRGPFVIENGTQVRALVLRDGVECMRLAEHFHLAPPPRWTDRRYVSEANSGHQIPDTVAGQLVGRWRNGDVIIELKADGTCLNESGANAHGRWWYALPVDAFEAATDPGQGELYWPAQSPLPLKLEDLAGTAIWLGASGQEIRFERVHRGGNPG